MDAPTPPIWLTEKFPPSRDKLLRLLVCPMPEPLLREIANCDYGCGYDENLDALKSICRSADIPTPLGWHPREVCCLTRWSEEHRQPLSDRKSIREFHHKRAFACCILIMAEAGQLHEEEGDTLVQFVESIVALEQPKFADAAISMLMWRLSLGEQQGTDRPFFVFAIILMALLNKSFRISPLHLSEMQDWGTAEELFVRWQQEQEEFQVWQVRPSWLIGLNRAGMLNQKWIKLASRLSDCFPVLKPLVSRMTLDD
jgi:hypothetical protein